MPAAVRLAWERRGCLLSSDAGGFITGANLVIDGGTAVMLRPNGMVD